MRPEKLYLIDIIDASDAITRFCEPVDEEQFLRDELRQSAVLQKLIIIGEAAARLPGDFRANHKEIEWEDIIGFRNLVVHEYFAILWQIVWNTAIQDVPDLRKKIQTILTDEYQED
ncbi:MAG: hypothetical protein A2136_11385 [Chloroflexi bacterium RBG_16_54_11]|nr:MAG: hypothetical protein A2136_11385 [Chloroflexi bacterium RBG_16_54_11]